MQGDFPSVEEFQASRVTNPAQSEILKQRLYDFQLYPTAGQTQLSFFQQPIGSGTTSALGNTVGATKSFWDTNMTLGGTLPSGMSFLIDSIEVLFTPGSVNTANTYTPAVLTTWNATAAATLGNAPNDVNTIYQSGMLELNVLSKNYVRDTPLLVFPPKAHLDLSAAVATNGAATGMGVQNLAKAGGRPWYCEPRITLQPAVNFEAIIRWPAAVATPSGFNGRIGVILDGYVLRASQ